MSAEDEELVSERKKIEDYLKLYCIEDVIDEALNKLVDVRPSNPYVALGQMIQAKTMPEIIDVKIHPICSANARGGVKASVITNLGTFYAYAGEAAGVSEGDTLRNYFSIEDRISSHMKSLNPCDMKQIDEYLDSVEDLEESVSLAVSMACCRAGAHHKGISLYRFLAELTDSNAGLPMPVVTVLSRAIGETEDASHTYHSQDITVIPTACTSVDNAIECCLQATSAVKIGVEERIKAGGMDIFELLQGVNGGCPRAKVSSLEAAMVLVKESLEKSAVLGEMRLGVDMHTGKVFVKGDEDVGAMYAVDGPENPLAGSDVNDTIISAWEATELISVEDPFLRDDIESLRDLQEKISIKIDEAREDASSDKFSYALSGVGRDATCSMQLIADSACTAPDQIRKLKDEKVFNSIKVRLRTYRTVSSAHAMCKASRGAGWAVIIGADEDCPETQDDFIVDFAVGVGACQVAIGNLHCAEGANKMNRLMEIYRENEDLSFVGREFRSL